MLSFKYLCVCFSLPLCVGITVQTVAFRKTCLGVQEDRWQHREDIGKRHIQQTRLDTVENSASKWVYGFDVNVLMLVMLGGMKLENIYHIVACACVIECAVTWSHPLKNNNADQLWIRGQSCPVFPSLSSQSISSDIIQARRCPPLMNKIDFRKKTSQKKYLVKEVSDIIRNNKTATGHHVNSHRMFSNLTFV